MTRAEKVQRTRRFIEKLQQIVATADLDDDCKQTLPRFHKCEQNLIRFLSDAGFSNDASVVESHASHIPATYGAPLIHTIKDDVEFYVGKLDAILQDLLYPSYAAEPRSPESPTAISNAATWNDIEKNLNDLDLVETETLRAFSKVSPPGSQNPAFNARFADAKQQIRDILQERSKGELGASDNEPSAKSEGLVRKIVIGIVITLVAGGSSPWWWAAIFPKPAVKIISAECSPDVLRNQLFRAASNKSAVIKTTATTMRGKLSLQEFKCVSDLAAVLLEQDPDNGHGLYFSGEAWRFEAMEDPKRSEFCRDRMREYFLKYITNEPLLPSDERNGNGKVCYERENGYCAERTAWISHLMAVDYCQWAEDSRDKITKIKRLERAARFSKIDLEFGGFDQVTPSAVLRERIEKELQNLGASYPTDP